MSRDTWKFQSVELALPTIPLEDFVAGIGTDDGNKVKIIWR